MPLILRCSWPSTTSHLEPACQGLVPLLPGCQLAACCFRGQASWSAEQARGGFNPLSWCCCLGWGRGRGQSLPCRVAGATVLTVPQGRCQQARCHRPPGAAAAGACGARGAPSPSSSGRHAACRRGLGCRGRGRVTGCLLVTLPPGVEGGGWGRAMRRTLSQPLRGPRRPLPGAAAGRWPAGHCRGAVTECVAQAR